MEVSHYDVDWLLDDDNPAVQYRTQTEIMGEKASGENAFNWLQRLLPKDWPAQQGLWRVYYLTAMAECGTTHRDLERLGDAREWIDEMSARELVNCGCGDFMGLRALVMLGWAAHPIIRSALNALSAHQLPDGGFLCLHRVKKLKHIPKSCIKANNLALMLCAECQKRGIDLPITVPLLSYYWRRRIFYRTSDTSTLVLNARPGWRTTDIFHPFEVMRIGLHNLVEAFCALGCGRDSRLAEAWSILKGKTAPDGKIKLEGTLTKSYLPKERVGKPSKWATFYAALAGKEQQQSTG